jgi:hypothetical protein
MPCALTGAQLRDCKDSVGGIKEVKIKVLPDSLSAYTLTSGVVTIAAGGQSGWATYTFEKETGNFVSTITHNEQNGTTFDDQTGTIIMNKLSARLHNELKLLAQNRLQVAVKYQDGTYFLFGYENGMSLSTAAAESGTAFGDRNGYTINLVGKEKEPAPNMSASTYDSLRFA